MKSKITLMLIGFLTLMSCGLFAQPTYGWANAINNEGPSQTRSSIVDNEGNLYIAGRFYGFEDFDPGPDTVNLISINGSGHAAFLVKYDSSGKYLWGLALGTLKSNSGDEVYSLALDERQNIYIAGVMDGTVDFDPGPGVIPDTAQGWDDAIIAKYSPDGNYIWHRKIGETFETAYGHIIRITPDGFILFAGTFSGSVDFDANSGLSILTSVGNTDLFLSKYDTSGNFYWAKRIGGGEREYVHGLEVDANGFINITGAFEDTVDFDPGASTANLASVGFEDIYVARYNALGEYEWAFSLGATSFDSGNDIAIDPSNNLVITGAFRNTIDFDPGIGTALLSSNPADRDIFLAKYSSQGEFVWAHSMGGQYTDVGIKLTIDNSGSIVLVGEFEDEADFDPGPGNLKLLAKLGSGFRPFDIFIAGYNSLGQILWANSIGGPELDRIHSLCSDSYLHIYLAGTFREETDLDPGWGSMVNFSGSGTNMFFTKYPTCIVDTAVIAIGPLTLEVNSITSNTSYQWLDCKNNLSPISGATGPSFTGVQNGRYAVSITRDNCSGTSNCHQLTLTGLPDANGYKFTIYPNPVSDVIYLTTNHPSSEEVRVTLYDLTGKALFYKTTDHKTLIEIPVSYIASGVYNMVIKVGKSTTFGKVLIVR